MESNWMWYHASLFYSYFDKYFGEDVQNLILQVHEVLIENTDKGSVITWDFDVMKHDVMFCVWNLQ